RDVSRDGRSTRTWILVSDDDSIDRILDEAEQRGATLLWRDHYWKEFNGFNAAFEDPWGNTLVLWVKGGDDPQIAEGQTREGGAVRAASDGADVGARRPARRRHRRLDRVVRAVHAAAPAREAPGRSRLRRVARPAG